MGDFLVDLGTRPTARRIVRGLGLPIPLPQRLRRETGPWRAQPLRDAKVAVSSTGELAEVLAQALAEAGADSWVSGDASPYRRVGEAWGRPVTDLSLDAIPDTRFDTLLFDGTGLTGPADLRSAYDFFGALVRSLGRCGRALVVLRPPESLDPPAAAASRAMEGFVRSLGKEIGRKGSTANAVYVDRGAEDRVAPVLRFVLSHRSAFISGQPLRVTSEVASVGDPAQVRPLDGKNALVTGAARGIGAAIARALAREGAHVLCLDRPEDDAPLSEVAREVGGTVVLCDVTDPDAARIIGDTNYALDIAVHNAGITRDKTVQNLSAEHWDQTIAVNLQAVVDLTTSLPVRDGGRVVCLSSIAGISGNVGQTNYAASKAGVIGFVQAYAPQLAERGVALNAIAPGFIETRLTRAIPAGVREVGRRLASLSQGGLPADVAEAVTFLAGPGAHGLNGQILRVCGGNFLGA